MLKCGKQEKITKAYLKNQIVTLPLRALRTENLNELNDKKNNESVVEKPNSNLTIKNKKTSIIKKIL